MFYPIQAVLGWGGRTKPPETSSFQKKYPSDTPQGVINGAKTNKGDPWASQMPPNDAQQITLGLKGLQ